jgi:hypothetical protein
MSALSALHQGVADAEALVPILVDNGVEVTPVTLRLAGVARRVALTFGAARRDIFDRDARPVLSDVVSQALRGAKTDEERDEVRREASALRRTSRGIYCLVAKHYRLEVL